MFDFLAGALDTLESAALALIDFLLQLVALIIQIIKFIWSVVLLIAQFFANIFIKALNFLRFLWNEFFAKIFGKLLNAIRAAHDWLETHLAPVLRVLRRVRDYIDMLYKAYVKPVMDIIQHVRKVLLIFRLLGFKWAQALDNRLLKIETDINRAFLFVRGYLNQVIDLLNGLSNPKVMLRVLIGTMAGKRIAAGFIRLWTGLPLGFFFPSSRLTALGFERAPMTRADLDNPLFNPPASQLFALWNDIPTLNFMATDGGVTDDALDTGDTIDISQQVYDLLTAGEEGFPGLAECNLDIEGTVRGEPTCLAGMADAVKALLADVSPADFGG